jgi:hypothetical protein
MGAHEGDGDVSAQVRKLPPAWCKLPFSGNLCHPESVFFNRLLAGARRTIPPAEVGSAGDRENAYERAGELSPAPKPLGRDPCAIR